MLGCVSFVKELIAKLRKMRKLFVCATIEVSSTQQLESVKVSEWLAYKMNIWSSCCLVCCAGLKDQCKANGCLLSCERGSMIQSLWMHVSC